MQAKAVIRHEQDTLAAGDAIDGMRVVIRDVPPCVHGAAGAPRARAVLMQDGMLRNTPQAIVKLASAAHAWVHEPSSQRSKLGIGLSSARSDIPTYSVVSRVEKAEFVNGEAGLAAFAEPHCVGYQSWGSVWYFVAVEEVASEA